ncbi:MAG: SCP2 sterol-binding domain-containing protein, partial [Actinomycetota bacterium]|nr:SCP2 sterol-binding domain-containing protein [Actinomycetota bacterium]
MTASTANQNDLDSRAELVSRFEPADMDVPGGRARIRLEGGSGGAVDALVEGGVASLVPGTSGDPDAVLRANPEVWDEIASDVRAGMAAYRAGRLSIRHNLHLG